MWFREGAGAREGSRCSGLMKVRVVAARDDPAGILPGEMMESERRARTGLIARECRGLREVNAGGGRCVAPGDGSRADKERNGV